MKTISSILNEQDACLDTIKKVAIIDSNSGSGFEFGCACELFLKKPEYLDQWYQGKVFGKSDLYDNNSNINLAKLTSVLLKFDMLILTDARVLNSVNSAVLLTALSLYHQAGGRLVAFGGGILVLAQAGLLDNKPVPANSFDQAFRDAYPNLSFLENSSFCFQDNIYVAGYGFNSLELGLFLIGEDWGSECVKSFVNQLNLAPSLVQDIELRLRNHDCQCEKQMAVGSSRIRAAMDWAQLNLGIVENVDQLAEKAFLSRRSFDRQFRAAMGLSAKDWLTDRRLSLAKEYLHQSELSIEEIATLTGFGNSNNFRNNFIKAVGSSPSAFRRGD